MNPKTDADMHRLRAAESLNECLQLLQHSEAPDWAAIQRLISLAQKEAGIAEFLTSDEVPASIEPEAEPVVNIQPEIDSEPAVAQAAPSAGISLAEKLSEQPLENLKNHLSINNRVRFAALLTEGSVPGLLELCDELQACPNFESAQQLLLAKSGDLDWEDEDAGGPEFLSMVRRLFLHP